MLDQPLPKVWLIRGGKHGQDEEAALSKDLAIIGFLEVPDLASFESLDGLIQALLVSVADGHRKRAENFGSQLWAFAKSAAVGDTVVLPLKTSPGQVALGRMAGPYAYQRVGESMRHTRPVTWLATDVPRSRFQQDLLYSFGAFMTVCRITRNDAQRRVAAVLEGRPDPGPTPGSIKHEDVAEQSESDAAATGPGQQL